MRAFDAFEVYYADRIKRIRAIFYLWPRGAYNDDANPDSWCADFFTCEDVPLSEFVDDGNHRYDGWTKEYSFSELYTDRLCSETKYSEMFDSTDDAFAFIRDYINGHSITDLKPWEIGKHLECGIYAFWSNED